MNADELMRLVSRYVEACDDLGEGLFEKPLTTTDALHAKATELHGQILAEVYRLHTAMGSLERLWPVLERAMSGLVFTADQAGEVQADMNTLRASLKRPNA